MSQIKSNEVMHGEFDRLVTVAGDTLPGPWTAACLSGYTGPTWVWVDDEGSIVPLSAVVVAMRAPRVRFFDSPREEG